MSKKVKGEEKAVESEQVQVVAGEKVYETYTEFLEANIANWSQLGLAMDAALSVKFGSEEFKDEADMVIEGAAMSFLKDIDNLRSFFLTVIGVETGKSEQFNFVPEAELETEPAPF